MLKTTTILAGLSAIALAVTGTQTQQQLPTAKPAEQSVKHEDQKQIQCLAENIYHEARNQPIAGKIVVTNVVQNRVEDPRFPKTPCSVIKQKRGKTCQFSWVCRNNGTPKDVKSYRLAYTIAEKAYRDQYNDLTRGAKFYHAKYVNPRWKYTRTVTIGDHIFYKG